MNKALCVPANRPVIDLTDIDENSAAADVELARILCSGCPVLVSCRRNALRTTDVAGFAGGLTEQERTVWRSKHHVHVTVLTVADVTPASELTADILDDLPRCDDGLHQDVIDVVLRMTEEGVAALDIVAAIDQPDAVTHRTVNYIRHRYAKGPSRVDA